MASKTNDKNVWTINPRDKEETKEILDEIASYLVKDNRKRPTSNES